MSSSSLAVDYIHAQQRFDSLEDSDLSSGSEEYQSIVISLLEEFAACELMVDGLAPFSSNEEVDDIPTADLKYFLLPFYQAELYFRRNGSNRRYYVHRADAYYRRFLERCESYGIMNSEDRSIFASGGSVFGQDPRTMKIQRFRREKELKEQTQVLRNRYIQALSSSKGADETVDIGVLSGRYDIEDLERPLLLSMIEQSMLSALESIKYLGEEERLLEFEKDQLEQGIDPSKVPADEVVPKPKVWHIPVDREVYRQNVFRERNPPTMTLDQYLELEMSRGGGLMPPDAERLHMGSGHIDRNAENAKEDECEEDEREARDGDDDDDAKLMESRRWDDFKDENPRGWGNSRR